MQTKTVKIKDINLNSPIQSPLLPNGFIERIRKFKEILAEVETTSLEQTILNFQHDKHPERELIIWEYIASVYEKFTTANPDLNLAEKKDVLAVALNLSMNVKTRYRKI